MGVSFQSLEVVHAGMAMVPEMGVCGRHEGNSGLVLWCRWAWYRSGMWRGQGSDSLA